MARRVMGFALLYALLLVLAPSDADGAVFNRAEPQPCPSVGPAVTRSSVLTLHVLSTASRNTQLCS